MDNTLLIDKTRFHYPAPPSSNCVLYLPGYPPMGSTIYDRSGEGNDGTISGATWTRLPSGLWCQYFDGGDDVVNCGGGTSLRVTTGLTIEFWGNLTEPADQMVIISRGYDTAWEFGVGGSLAGDANNMFFYAGNTRTRTANIMAGSWGVWKHYAIFFNPSIDTVWANINTVEVWNEENLGTIADNANELEYGRRLGSTLWMKGYIALLRFYNTTASGAVLARHYANERHLLGV